MEAILNRVRTGSSNNSEESGEQNATSGVYICAAAFSPIKVSEECYYSGIEIKD